MDGFRQDVRFALRQLARNPGFAALAVLTLALGIGANTAIFSVVNGVVLRPLPYPDANRITYLGWDWGGGPNSAFSAYKFDYWREHSQAFEAMAVLGSGTFEVEVDGSAGDVRGLRATGDLLRVLGTPPVLGRDFLPEESVPGGPDVALLGHTVWQDRFGGDPDVVGRTIRVDGAVHTVVGVLPPDFQYVGAPGSDGLLVPFRLRADPADLGHNFLPLARLAPGITPAAARADMAAIFQRFSREHPGLLQGEGEGAGFMSFQDIYVGDLQRTLWVLLGAVGLVLLIACANVANLLLARAAARRREIATRAALGAGRSRIISQILTESLVIAGIAGAIGLLLGLWTLNGLLALLPQGLPRMDEIGLDFRVLVFALGASALTGVVFGLAAALPASRSELTSSLKAGASGEGARRGVAFRDMLIAAEVAVSLVLLAGSGLLVTSFLQLRSVDPGFDPARVLTVDLGRAPDGYTSGEAQAELVRQLEERLGGARGVQVAAATNLPLQRGWNIPISIVGRPGEGEPAIEWRAVSPAYFATLDVPLVRGRAFTDFDRTASAPVAIINEATARAYWPDADPIGQRVHIAAVDGQSVLPGDPDPIREIVGVVGDIREVGLDVVPRRTVYVPQSQALATLTVGLPQVMIRTDQPAETREAVRRALVEIDPRLREPAFGTLEGVVTASIAQDRFNTLLVGSFAGLALILTLVGIFGVVSYTVRRRTHEIGIRIALGAGSGRVRAMVVGQGMRVVAVGLVVGLAATFALTRFLEGMLFGIAPRDPLTLAGVSAALAGAALLASYLPARRATRVDPMVALRTDG